MENGKWKVAGFSFPGSAWERPFEALPPVCDRLETGPCRSITIRSYLLYGLIFLTSMETVNIPDCERNLSRILSRVELGEEIIISNQGIPIAKLVPFRTASNRRASLGKDRGKFVLPEDFKAPLQKDIEAANESAIALG